MEWLGDIMDTWRNDEKQGLTEKYLLIINH